MKNLFLMPILIIFFVACSKETPSEQESEKADKEILEFTYRGVDYSSTYYVNDFDEPIFDNPTVAEVYRYIMDNDLPVVFCSDGQIKICDSQTEFLGENIESVSENENRITPQAFTTEDEIGSVTFFDRENFSGVNFGTALYKDVREIQDYSNLSYIGWNNRITSATINAKRVANGYAIVVALYDDYDFKGKCRAMEAKVNAVHNWNLNDYTFKLFRTWGDKTSSITVRYSPKF